MHKELNCLSDSHHDLKVALNKLEDEKKIPTEENIQINQKLSNL